MSVFTLDTLEELKALRDEWQALADVAVEPNVFYEPWMCIPAWEHLREGAVVCVGVRAESGELIGFLPLEWASSYRRFPIRHLRSWQHRHAFLCTPLIRHGSEMPFWQELFAWVDSQLPHHGFLELRLLRGDGPVSAALHEFCRRGQRTTCVTDSYERALLTPPRDAESYLRERLSGKRRKEVRRKMNRLEEFGHVHCTTFPPIGELKTHVDSFLTIEASGWKGRASSALHTSQSDERFFRSICSDACRLGKLLMTTLSLDGQPLAMQCAFVTNGGGFAFKIAYDEAWARYSPGVLLEIEALRCIPESPALQWLDSCAAPEHPMINRLWGGRRPIERVNVARSGWISRQVVSGLARLRAFVKRRERKVHEPTPEMDEKSDGDSLD